jgi:TRC40/GET3/ArsA family transport-energizing ATPase
VEPFDRLQGKGLIIFAGKGGVGKTTCSAAVALHTAAQGRRTLLVTVDPAKRLEDSLGVPLSSRETQVVENLWASMLDPEEIIRDRLSQYAEGEKVMEHPLFRYVSNYLPGLNELIAIGRLNELRHEAEYDVVIVDTAPTGHALSFLSAPRAIQEIMSEKSLLRWAMRGYTLWMRVNKASRGLSRFFGGRPEEKDTSAQERTSEDEGDLTQGSPEKKDARKAAEEVDIEAVFQRLAGEAQQIQSMLTDPERTALNIVTLPEKLPVEETVDLHREAIDGLGIPLGYIVVNKLQPDTLGDLHEGYLALKEDVAAQDALRSVLRDHGHPERLWEAMHLATMFSERRRKMNLSHIAALRRHLPDAPMILLPLFREDVAGLDALTTFRDTMYRTLAEN